MSVTAEKLAAAQQHAGWSQVREEVLQALWAEGHSCSLIAKMMKHVSRNAVIGKATRMGLSGRGAPSRPTLFRLERPLKAPPVAKARPNPLGNRAGRRPSAPKVRPDPHITRVATSKASAKVSAAPPLALPPEPPRPPGPVVDLMDLQPHHCRWPIGSPGEDGFGFCGADKVHGSYCAAHGRRAYTPLPSGKPRTGNELARSLRRYA